MFDEKHSHAYKRYEEALDYKKYAIKRRDSKNVAATLKEVHPMLEIEQGCLDANEFLLNTLMATFDLRQGIDSPIEHRTEDFITK